MPQGIVRKYLEFPHLMTEAEVQEHVESHDWYGYHPNGYDGWAEVTTGPDKTGRRLNVNEKEELSSTWYWCRYGSCD